jgi:hypothetical protein
LRLGVGDHAQAGLLRQADHEGGEQARAARHRQRLPTVECEEFEPELRGQAGHRERRGLLQRRALGDRDHRGRGRHQQLPLRAALGSEWVHGRHHLLADLQPLHAGADRVDRPGRVPPRYPRRRNVSGIAVLSQPDVGWVDRGRLDGDAHLTRPGLGCGTGND